VARPVLTERKAAYITRLAQEGKVMKDIPRKTAQGGVNYTGSVLSTLVQAKGGYGVVDSKRLWSEMAKRAMRHSRHEDKIKWKSFTDVGHRTKKAYKEMFPFWVPAAPP
jgi:hypothetical protein